MAELAILKELKDLIPPLSEEERKNLENSIQEEGCRDALIAWKKSDSEHILIDGHNRYEICQRNEIQYDVKYKEFKSIEAVKTWMILNQLSRRNITDTNKNYLIGLMYKQIKSDAINSKIRNLKNLEKGDEKEEVDTPNAEQIAKENGISDRTVRNTQKLVEGIEIVLDVTDDEEKDDVKKKILSEKVSIPQKTLQQIATIDNPEEQKKIAKEVTEAVKSEDKNKLNDIKGKIANASKGKRESGDIGGLTTDTTAKLFNEQDEKRKSIKKQDDYAYYEPKTQEENDLQSIRNILIEKINTTTLSVHLQIVFKVLCVKPESNEKMERKDYGLYRGASKDLDKYLPEALELNPKALESIKKEMEKYPFVQKYDSPEYLNFDFDEKMKKHTS